MRRDCATRPQKLSYDFWYMRHGNLAVDVAVCVRDGRCRCSRSSSPRPFCARGAGRGPGRPREAGAARAPASRCSSCSSAAACSVTSVRRSRRVRRRPLRGGASTRRRPARYACRTAPSASRSRGLREALARHGTRRDRARPRRATAARRPFLNPYGHRALRRPTRAGRCCAPA